MFRIQQYLIFITAVVLSVRAADEADKLFGAPLDYTPLISPPISPRPDMGSNAFNTVFDFPTDDISKGGCTQVQKDALLNSFNEVVEMSAHVYDYLQNELVNKITTVPEIGQMLWAVFGIAPSKFILTGGGGIFRGNEDVATIRAPFDGEANRILQYMTGLMVLIGKHSSGNLPWKGSPVTPKTRLYCDSSWRIIEEYQRDNQGKITPIKYPEGRKYIDLVTGFTDKVPTGQIFDFAKGLCGNDGDEPGDTQAMTSPEYNAMTFCPSIWTPAMPRLIPREKAVVGLIPPTALSDLDSLSSTFFHEYLHLIGKSLIKGGIGDQEIDGETCYGFPNCVRISSSRLKPFINADSYLMLAYAAMFPQCDWRDGTCKIYDDDESEDESEDDSESDY